MEGKCIDSHIYEGKKSAQRYNTFNWPKPFPLTTKSIAEWKRFMRYLHLKYAGTLGSWKKRVLGCG